MTEPRRVVPRLFVILAAPRTGSNMLCSMLNSHPAILCHHELFNPGGIHYALDVRTSGLDLGGLDERDRDPIGFLHRVWAEPHGASVIGFKLSRGQNEAAFHAVLADRAVRKIILLRRNRIRTFISECNARRTGQWESYDFSDQSPSVPPLWVDADELWNHVATNDRYYGTLRATLRAARQERLEIAYEDLACQTVQRSLLEYLDVRADAALRPATRKISPHDLRALVANYDALARALSGSELEGDIRDADHRHPIEAARVDAVGIVR